MHAWISCRVTVSTVFPACITKHDNCLLQMTLTVLEKPAWIWNIPLTDFKSGYLSLMVSLLDWTSSVERYIERKVKYYTNSDCHWGNSKLFSPREYPVHWYVPEAAGQGNMSVNRIFPRGKCVALFSEKAVTICFITYPICIPKWR